VFEAQRRGVFFGFAAFKRWESRELEMARMQRKPVVEARNFIQLSSS
jgi:hypothetical protein